MSRSALRSFLLTLLFLLLFLLIEGLLFFQTIPPLPILPPLSLLFALLSLVALFVHRRTLTQPLLTSWSLLLLILPLAAWGVVYQLHITQKLNPAYDDRIVTFLLVGCLLIALRDVIYWARTSQTQSEHKGNLEL
jgi:hypothetical protein